MNQTDAAFVAAYQQASVGISPTPSEPTHGPHFHARPASGRGKAPLSQLMAGAPDAGSAPLVPGVELASLAWPTMAERLAAASEIDLIGLLTRYASPGEETPRLAFYGAENGIGATTTLLSLTRVASRAGFRVALIDAVGGEGAIGSLFGVWRTAEVGSIETGGIDAALIHGRADSVSLFVSPGAEPSAARSVIDRLAVTHDLVLIDAGVATGAALWNGLAEPVLVDRRRGGDAAARGAAAKRLASSDDSLAWIETLVEAE